MKNHVIRPTYESGSHAKTQGFTLVELMIAIFLLVVGLLSMAGLSVSVIQGNNFSKQMTSAATLGQERLESKRTMSFANITSAIDNYNSIPEYSSFKRVVTVPAAITITPLTGARYKKITVKTFWAGDLYNFQLETIVAE